jgi:hypothetical protein
VKKVGIFYEFTKGGAKQTAEVSVDAESESAAKKKFEGQFKGKIDRVISTRTIGRP